MKSKSKHGFKLRSNVLFTQITAKEFEDIIGEMPEPNAKLFFCDYSMTKDETLSVLYDKLPFGTTIHKLNIWGYHDGVDGTLIEVTTSYSHS